MGYGKTVFMNEWKAEQPEIKKVWYHISYVDNDWIVFMEYLAVAVKRQMPGFCFALDSYKEMKDERYVCERMGAEFCQELEKAIEEDPDTESLILMLDDFQEIVTDRVAGLMENILKYLPEGVRIFMSTKGALPWFTDRQKLEDLAFDEEETRELAEKMRLQVKMDDFSSWVWEYTEGWPAGIMFIYLYVRQNQGRMDFGIYLLETGEKISWRTKKARECVALLLSQHPKHLSREELLFMLWDEEEMPKQEVANLHNLLSSIRKSLLPY